MNLKFLHPCCFFFLPFSCDVFSSRPVIIIYLFILQADIPPLSRRDVGRKSQRLNAVFSLYGGRSARGRPVRSQSCWIRLKKKKKVRVCLCSPSSSLARPGWRYPRRLGVSAGMAEEEISSHIKARLFRDLAERRSLGHCAQSSMDELEEVPLLTTERCGKVIKV